jgi:hypothetical protein
MMKTKKIGPFQSFKNFANKHFEKTSFDDMNSSRILAKRVGSAFKSAESRELVLAMPAVGAIAAICFLLFGRDEGVLKSGVQWLFQATTELESNFLFWILGLACLLVGTHKPEKAQLLFPKRLLFLPIVRLTSDTVAAACTAFFVIAFWCFCTGQSVKVGESAPAAVLTAAGAFWAFAYYGLAYLFFTSVRLLVDSPVSSALFRPIHNKDPGLRRTLRLMGFSGFAVVALFWFFAYRFLLVSALNNHLLK